jgi:hypothetical protein
MSNFDDKETITRAKIQELLSSIKGETRGIVLKTDWDFIFRHYQHEGIEKLEKKMEEWGVPLKYKEIKETNFIPLSYDLVSLLAIGEVFNFKESDFIKLGKEEAKTSTFLKLFFRYFVSLKTLVQKAPEIWQKHYSIGCLEVEEINEKEKYILLALKNFKVHPLYTQILGAYFSETVSLIIGKETQFKVIKDVFKGDSYIQYRIFWNS